jgi:hypothetical protein
LDTDAAVAEKDRLYRALDRLLPLKADLEQANGQYGEMDSTEMFEILAYKHERLALIHSSCLLDQKWVDNNFPSEE